MLKQLMTLRDAWVKTPEQQDNIEIMIDSILNVDGTNPIESITYDEVGMLIITMENGIQINIPDEA